MIFRNRSCRHSTTIRGISSCNTILSGCVGCLRCVSFPFSIVISMFATVSIASLPCSKTPAIVVATTCECGVLFVVFSSFFCKANLRLGVILWYRWSIVGRLALSISVAFRITFVCFFPLTEYTNDSKDGKTGWRCLPVYESMTLCVRESYIL